MTQTRRFETNTLPEEFNEITKLLVEDNIEKLSKLKQDDQIKILTALQCIHSEFPLQNLNQVFSEMSEIPEVIDQLILIAIASVTNRNQSKWNDQADALLSLADLMQKSNAQEKKLSVMLTILATHKTQQRNNFLAKYCLSKSSSSVSEGKDDIKTTVTSTTPLLSLSSFSVKETVMDEKAFLELIKSLPERDRIGLLAAEAILISDSAHIILHSEKLFGILRSGGTALSKIILQEIYNAHPNDNRLKDFCAPAYLGVSLREFINEYIPCCPC